ncbi:MAG TPA: HAMP domain-containing protein, partial [Steroidobacteraceae bacterium]
MSFVWVGWLALALVAAAFAVLYLLQRRELKSVGLLSQEVQRIAIGGRLGGRVEVQTPSSEVSALMTAINHLLTRAAAGT